MKINKISVSRAEVYSSCPQKYKYRYHLEIKPEKEKFYFTYGKIVHKIAEVYVSRKGDSTINEVSQEVLDGKIPIEEDRYAPELPYEYRQRLPKHLNSICKITERLGFEGHTEYKFRYDLDPPNNKFFEGVIDRIVIQDDNVWILDYKTTQRGRFRKNSYTIFSDLQVRAYARVVQKEFGAKAENIKAALYYLEDAELVAIKFCERTLANVESHLLKHYDKIDCHHEDFVVGIPGYQCNNCDYNNICPFSPK